MREDGAWKRSVHSHEAKVQIMANVHSTKAIPLLPIDPFFSPFEQKKKKPDILFNHNSPSPYIYSSYNSSSICSINVCNLSLVID